MCSVAVNMEITPRCFVIAILLFKDLLKYINTFYISALRVGESRSGVHVGKLVHVILIITAK